MSLAAAWVTLRQHRVEVGIGAGLAILAGLLGVSIMLRIAALDVDPACVASNLASSDGSDVAPDCFALVREAYQILGETFLKGEGTLALSIMGVLPFLVGLLGGVPIVGRELEARTASTAWSLHPSRRRWLVRQSVPIAVVVGGALALASLIAIPVVADHASFGFPASTFIGEHGLPALVRGFAAFGIGLLTGALLGRTLPALLFGIAISVALLWATGTVRDAWLHNLEPQVISDVVPGTGESVNRPGAIATGNAIQVPDGRVLSMAQARELATAAGVPAAAPDDIQDAPAAEWYAAQGYVALRLGVSDAQALDWAMFDSLIFGLVGLAAIGWTVLSVDRRRPE